MADGLPPDLPHAGVSRPTLKDIQLGANQGPKLNEAQLASIDNEGYGVNDVITEMQTPQWLEMLLAVTRISELQIKIAEEKAEREKDTYQNPYPILESVVSSIKFDAAVAVFILINCLIIGMQASWPDDGQEMLWSTCEHFFVALFLVEWLLRIRAFGWVWCFELPNAADTFVVFVTGVMPKWILEPMGTDVTVLRILSVLRTLRLVRIVRTARHLPQCKELWMLIQGLLQVARPLLWISVIALMILYIFGIAATEIIGRQPMYRHDAHVQAKFGNPLKSMFTMLQVMTLDSWGYDIARPVMEKEIAMGYFFVVFIMVSVFVFGNLVTAVIVERVLSISKVEEKERAKEEEQQKHKDMVVLKELLATIDADGSGELSIEEFTAAVDNPKVQTMLDCINIRIADLEEVWDILDEGDGVLSIEDFSRGLRRTKGDAKAKDIIEIIKRLRQTGVRHAELQSQVRRFNETVLSLEHDVERIQADTSEALGLFQEVYHRLNAHIKREQGEDRLYALKQAKLREEEPPSDDDDEEEGEEGGPKAEGGGAAAAAGPASPAGAAAPPAASPGGG